VKAAVFGFIIALMGCYHGYNSRGGAQGVGTATTNAVVSASILILLSTTSSPKLFLRSDRAMTTPKIQLSGVKKRFGSKVVLDGIDLDVEPRANRSSSSAARAPASR
jgi:hypothetical protein